MFYKHLEKLGAENIILPPKHVYPIFIKMKEVVEKIHKVIKERGTILLVRDYDPDGMYAGEIVKEYLDHIGYTNYVILPYTARTHDIDPYSEIVALRTNIDLMIIMDTGSSQPSYIRKLMDTVPEIVVIDHHESDYSYEDYEGITIINTTMERKAGNDFYLVSAATLTYLVIRELVIEMGEMEPPSLAVLALCSMYSDSIDMSSNLARLIYYKAVETERRLFPKVVIRFLDERTPFNRRFIEFTLNPQLNSLFRSESFVLLNSLLGWKPSLNGVAISDIVSSIRNTYEFYRDEVIMISDIISTEIVGEFVLGNLSSVINITKIESTKLHHYTGLVANKLSEKFNKPAIVYADSGVNIKCSLRDVNNRNFLPLFKKFSNANGHNSAFAINIKYIGFHDFIQYLYAIDKTSYDYVINEPIVLDYSLEDPTVETIKDVALYNEFSGNLFPIILVSKVWRDPKRSSYRTFYKRYKWVGLNVKSRAPILDYSRVIMKPYISKEDQKGRIPELMVERIVS